MVKIRLARRGRKKLAKFDIVVTDSRAPRDGRFIEKIGIYDPATIPATIDLSEEKAFDWLMKGAQPSDTVGRMLSYRGILMKKHLQIGVIKGAITQDQADAKLAEWKKSKESQIASKVDVLAKARVAAKKAKYEAEKKVKEARAEAIKKKAEVVEAAPAEVPAVEGEASAEAAS
jgi:small subunit ribosomal protein S16